MRPLLLAICLCVGTSGTARAQECSLSDARAAFERAEFDAALAVVDELLTQSLSDATRAEALRLRATLLFALRAGGWRETLSELARLAPSYDMPPSLPPQILSEWQLARAALLAPRETMLAIARAAYVVADFEGTLEVLRRLPHALTPEQQVERLVLEALARFGLRDRAGTERALRKLARISPDRTFGSQVPPSFREAWRLARSGTRTFQES